MSIRTSTLTVTFLLGAATIAHAQPAPANR